MKNKLAFVGLSFSILLFLAIIGFEIYINGRPENYDYCNVGAECYYEYGAFAWSNVEWSKIFGSVIVYAELLFLLPFFIYFTSKIKGRPDGSYKSIWLKIIMLISSIPLIIVFLRLLVHSQHIVIDYDVDRDPTANGFFEVFAITMVGYYINMFCWIMVYLVKKIFSVIKQKRKR